MSGEAWDLLLLQPHLGQLHSIHVLLPVSLGEAATGEGRKQQQKEALAKPHGVTNYAVADLRLCAHCFLIRLWVSNFCTITTMA